MHIQISPNSSITLPPKKINNFYNYVNHEFFQNNSIPDDKTSWGYFNILAQNSLENQHKLLNNLPSNPLNDSHHQNLLSTFWNNCSNIYEMENIPSLLQFSNSLIKKSKSNNLGIFLANLSKNGINPFIYFGSSFDYKNSNLIIAAMGFGGLTLSDKDYYFNNEHEKTRNDFKEYLKDLSELTNQNFEFIFDYEKEIAKYHLSKEEKRDPHKTYNPHNLNQIYKLSSIIQPFLENNKYLDKFGDIEHKINISNPEGLQKHLEKLQNMDMEILEKII